MKSLILSFILAGLLLVPITQATIIYVSGDVSGTWSADTVIVTAEVRVPPGQSLTIMPGVEVLFWVSCKFIVDNNATLTAVGTLTDSIRFDEYWTGNRWKGVRFLSASSSSQLAYCHLKHGSATGSVPDNYGGAIYCSSSSPTIRHCLLDSCAAICGGAISCNNNSSPTISGNTIIENSASSGGGIHCYYSSPTISGNTIIENSASSGGIYCYYSSPTISGNTISGNSTYYEGGGIYCYYSSPTISGNTISGNSAFYGGGGIHCEYNSSPTINGNTISGNSAYYSGGGIYCYNNSSPTISGNTLSGNTASGTYGHGGGIYCDYNSSPSISGNTISGNSAISGGGVYCLSTSAPSTFTLNEISENSASSNGGGIYISGVSFAINKNTIAANTAAAGGGLYCTGSSPTVINSILWGNSPQQIFQTSGSNVQVTYSDHQGIWPGTGNINADPTFVNAPQGDYRLQWGSPCIDTGDPSPTYNDPDGTRADMGCYFYDQGGLVRILLTPYNTPIQIPIGGGSFNFGIQATNIGGSALATTVWCNVTLPSGFIYGPVLGPVIVSLGAGATLSRLRTQIIPGGAPAGLYRYNGYAVAAGDTSSDYFMFEKLGATGEPGLAGWSNSGESFDLADVGAQRATPASGSGATPTMEVMPNPFNPATVIRYQLPVASRIQLSVFDVSGRLVETLVNGWRQAGEQEVNFDGSRLASGIYICRLQGDGHESSQKMVLLK